MTPTDDPRAALVEAAFDERGLLQDKRYTEAVLSIVDDLDCGALRVATRGDDGEWAVHAWVQKAVVLYFGFAPTATTIPSCSSSTRRTTARRQPGFPAS